MSGLLRAIGVVLVGLAVAWFPAAAGANGPDDGESKAAAEPGPEDSDLTEYVEVDAEDAPSSNTILTKLPVPTQRTPSNVGVVPRKVIREQESVVLGDALPNISGVNVQAGPAVHDFFAIRGFDSLSSTLVMTDGAPELEAVFYDMYNVEGVEVLKGPGGFLYGARPLAGTVNMIRKQPLPGGDFVMLRALAGSFDTYEGLLDWNTGSRDGARTFRLNGVYRSSDNYRDDKDSRYVAVNPGFNWNFGEDSSLNFNIEYVDAEFKPDAGLPVVGNTIPDVPRTNSYQSPVDFSDQQVGRFQLNYETRLSESVRLRNKTYYRSLDWKSDGTLLNGVFPSAGGLMAIRNLTRLDDEQRLVGNQFEAILEVSTGTVRHNLLTGLEVAHFTDVFEIGVFPSELAGPGGMPSISVFNPVETFSGVNFTLPVQAGDARTLELAPYVTDQMRVSSKVELLLGIRYDFIDFENDGAVGVGGGLMPTQVSRQDGELSPMLGVVYAPNATFSLYANAGRAFAPPSARIFGELEPERSTQVELGVKKRLLSDKLQSTFAIYRIERDNIAIPDANGVTQQAGDQLSRGFEVDLGAELARRLRLRLTYAYNDSELTRFARENPPTSGNIENLSGNRPPYAPRQLASLWISKTFSGGLGLAGGVRYFGDQYFNADNAFKVSGAVIFGGAVFYDLGAWRLQLNLRNLTDARFETGSFASTSVVPGDPFAAFGSIQYRF